MDSERILSQLGAAAAENGGRPPGAKAFYSDSGISRNDFWKAGFAKYSDAVKAAGLEPNSLTVALKSEEMLGALAALVRRIGRFPVIGDIKVARVADATLPSYEAFRRLAGGVWHELPAMLLSYCQRRPEYSDVANLLGESEAVPDQVSDSRAGRVTGYVYLAKHGRDYKIGRSNDVARRRREIALLLPSEFQHVHVIETDDPEGIEQYWHRRFADRRTRGEWFRLTPEDVLAFRRRRYQ